MQLLTGARAGELVGLRDTDIDCSRGDVWTHIPQDQKTAHHGKGRRIYFGPRAQKILRLVVTPGSPGGKFLFMPTDAERERHAAASVHRRPNQSPNQRLTSRVVGLHYTTASYPQHP